MRRPTAENLYEAAEDLYQRMAEQGVPLPRPVNRAGGLRPFALQLWTHLSTVEQHGLPRPTDAEPELRRFLTAAWAAVEGAELEKAQGPLGRATTIASPAGLATHSDPEGYLTASEILALLKTVDGDGSGLDADLLDGLHASAFPTLLATASANDDATVDFTLDGSYGVYLLTMARVVPATDDVVLCARVSIGGTFQTANYHWSTSVGSNFDAAVGAATVNLSFAASNRVGSAAGENFSGELLIPSPADTATYKNLSGVGAYNRSLDGQSQSGKFGGAYMGATSAIDGIRILFASSNIESGEFALWGLGNVS